MKRLMLILLSVLIVVALVVSYFVFLDPSASRNRTAYVVKFIRNPEEHADWVLPALSQCNNAPFLFPTTGFIGYLWDDTFKPGHRHQGIDIFAGTDVGITPVYAAYDGYLTREDGWVSTVIVRIPSDPLHPSQQIWTYYTHMADAAGNSFVSAEFPAGTHEVFVKAGTLLGYQGNYSGDPANPTGVHLHFSVVRDDGNGKYTNELEIANTYDPSAYLGLPLNASDTPQLPILCNSGQ
ncbi:MAG: M23 family metallopeptidase [Anaerolineaceae bacterium]|nr:M23 family metallopeptidase [Anaerolineaceae bacterium]